MTLSRWWTLAVVLFASSSIRAEEKENWSTLRGRVIWSGEEIPENKALDPGRDQSCCEPGGKRFRDDWVIDPKSRGVRWVMVWLEPDPEVKPRQLPIHPDLKEVRNDSLIIELKNCRFQPHVHTGRLGQSLIIRNSDVVPHAVKSSESDSPIGTRLYPAKQSFTFVKMPVSKSAIFLDCPIHPEMRGLVRFFDHPYFAVTDQEGKFEIEKVPVGKFRLKVWQESNGWRGGRHGRFGEVVSIEKKATNDLGEITLNPEVPVWVP